MTQIAAAKEMVERISNMSEDPSLEELLKLFSFIEKPLNEHVFIHIDNFQYKGKIIIPEKNKRSPTKGVIVAVGDNIKDLVPGDRVLYSQFAGYLLKFEDVPVCRCLGYSELLAKLRSDAPVLSVEGA
jgi:co-chaperonin GroES (HSP10)